MYIETYNIFANNLIPTLRLFRFLFKILLSVSCILVLSLQHFRTFIYAKRAFLCVIDMGKLRVTSCTLYNAKASYRQEITSD